MTIPVLLAVLGAALLHATWNALVRIGASRVGAMVVLSVVQGGVGFLIALTRPFPSGEVWLWLLSSGLIHTAYKVFLTFAYEHGDLSRVYPLARGTAPLVVLVVGSAVLGESLAAAEVAGIVTLGGGILMLARGVWTSGESLKLLPFALGSALATAGYTVVDGLGARILGDATAFVGWMFLLDGIGLTLFMLVVRGSAAIPRGWRAWGTGGVAALASYGSYWVAVWAMTLAPIALVAALRETSILFAVLIGWLIFRERMTPGKAASVGLIVAGVVLTRL
ncbi:EamA family transporter [Ostreiculturibacter nitratireducens]|uniref:EamA family transporter n=1 Tax=Ostreiculturibacter nitratireducens TaxID=3075226 RepID=UPI0031B6242E